MFERVLILSAVLLLSILWLKKPGLKKKSTREIKNLPFDNLNKQYPTLLYFWTEQCSQCKNVQAPFLENLKRENNKFNLLSLNALEAKELSSEFKIKTVPSTIIFSKESSILFHNSGLKTYDELSEQLGYAQSL